MLLPATGIDEAHAIPVTASIRVTAMQGATERPEDGLQRADAALYLEPRAAIAKTGRLSRARADTS